MKMEPVPVRMNFFRIITAHRPAVKEGNELRSIVRGRPFRKVFHLNLNDFVEFQVVHNRDDFRRRSRRRSWAGDFGDLRRRGSVPGAGDAVCALTVPALRASRTIRRIGKSRRQQPAIDW